MIAVVIPIYRYQPPPMEIFSLRRCIEVLSGYDLVFVTPAGLDTAWYRDICKAKKNAYFESFDDTYFTSIEGYSKLLVSKDFYARLLKYDFILIHQLDAYVFRDELTRWCDLNYDYIGGPWIDTAWHEDVCNGIKVTIFRKQSFIKRQLTKLVWMLRGISSPTAVRVGNGGLSLRKVRAFWEIANDADRPDDIYNEDLFWSIYVPLTRTGFKIPSPSTALGFCFDSNPALCLSLNNRQLPFAAHAWFRDEDVYKGNFDFWKTHIKT